MMARSLLIGWNEMTDKAMPDDSVRPTDADSDGNDGDDASRGGGARAAQAASPLITAIEIENFKGIGRPMRVDLRPVTLLFGNNSAGKSTVLHALCYAHEILSYGNVDAHKTELGGDRIDLGGFHNFVHAHDPTGTVRLRFELNLEDWEVPSPLRDTLLAEYFLADFELTPDDAELEAKSAWVELRIGLLREQPVVANYEIGVNGAFVGRLYVREQAGVMLEFDMAHPLLMRVTPDQASDVSDHSEREEEEARSATRAHRVREAHQPETGDWRHSLVPVPGLFSAMPHWGHALALDWHALQHGRDSADTATVHALVSTLLVGIGQSLRDELASFRYIGPVRELHSHARTDSAMPDQVAWIEAIAKKAGLSTRVTRTSDAVSWANGAAAWTLLRRSPRDFIQELSSWIARKDRLDTGYALRAQSIVTIDEENARLASTMREYHQLREMFGSAEGTVALDRWVQKQAEDVGADVEHAARVTMRRCRDIREGFAGVTGSDYFDEEVEEARQGIEMVDRYLQYLHESGSVDAIGARIKTPDDDGIHAPVAWGVEDTRALARIVARKDSRERHRDEIRKLKVQDAECLDRMGKLEAEDHTCRDEIRKYEAEYEDALNRRSRKECQILRKLLKNLAEMRKNTTAAIKDNEELRDRVSKLLNNYSGRVNAEEVEARISTPGLAELHARVEREQKEYFRLTELVAKMEQRDFTSTEVDALAAAMAARPPQREPQLVTTRTRLPVRTSDVGVGISQILPVVVATLDPGRPGITAIEQPELHLHPRIQVELGDLFASQAAKGGVFLIETHSEHLLLRFMKRMRQTYDGTLGNGTPRMRPEDITVYFVEIDPDGTETLIREMPLNERGDLVEAWPGGFFEEDLREIF